jgi:uncharacterized membrane protein
MKALTNTTARILFALPFGIFGINHFIFQSRLVGIVPPWIPGETVWVFLTGALFIAACVFIIGKLKYAHIFALLVGFVLIVFIFSIHIPGLFNVMTLQESLTNLLKDIALVGGAWTYAGILARKEQSNR